MRDEFAAAAARLAGFAALVAGWTPDIFWSSTPDDLALVAAAIGGDEPGALGRGDLAAMMERFPDG